MAPRIHSSVPERYAEYEELLGRAARATLASERVEQGELSVTALLDDPILNLNRRWLGHDWIPDVLSFALQEPGGPPVGDIYIGIEQAERQAAEHGVSLEEELTRLVIHGTLHVLGYDHPEASEARADSELYRAQEALVREVMARA